MKKRGVSIAAFFCASMILISCVGQVTRAQTMQEPSQGSEHAARTMNITGEIVRGTQGYVIRGKEPKEVFPVLNPNPAVLDKLVESGRTVHIEARIVLGDNVDIERIDGKVYRQEPEAPR